MAESFLLKIADVDTTVGTIPLPRRAFPATAPTAGDCLFLWSNARGLVAEARISVSNDETITIDAPTLYGAPIPTSWLDTADREKITIRSKLHCDRHDRLWHLTEANCVELDSARRFGGDA